MKFNDSKRMRKTLRPYLKNPELMLRLHKYLVLQGLTNSNEVSKEISSSRLSNPSKKIRSQSNNIQFPEKCGENSGSNSSNSFCQGSSKAENYANMSLRNLYSKSSLPRVPSTPGSSGQKRRSQSINIPPPEKSGIISNSGLSDFHEDSSKTENHINANLHNVCWKSSLPLHPEYSTPISNNQKNLSAYNRSSVPAEATTDEVSRKNHKNKVKKKGHQKSDDITGKDKTLFLQKSSVKFSDVGGLNNAIKKIARMIFPLRKHRIYQIIKPKLRSCGLLLYGPPGCGKTLIARAVVGEFDLNFIETTASELVSENKVNEFFEGAINNAPCILFIDEIDSITSKSDMARESMDKRIIIQLLKCMDDLKSKFSQVLVIGATNRLHLLDPALRRAGRFDREISIGIPDENARYEILKIQCNELRLSPDFDLHWLASNTPGYVGADLESITTTATNNAIDRNICRYFPAELDSFNDPGITWLKSEQDFTEKQLADFVVEVEDFKAAIQDYKPSTKKRVFLKFLASLGKTLGLLTMSKKNSKNQYCGLSSIKANLKCTTFLLQLEFCYMGLKVVEKHF